MLASVSIVDIDLSKGFIGLARNGDWGKAVTWNQLYNLLVLLERESPTREGNSAEKQIAHVFKLVGTHWWQAREQKTGLGI